MPQGSKVVPASEAVKMVVDGDIVAVNSSSGLCCPDAVLAALGERFDTEGSPRDITSVHPIAAGDMFGTTGTDHIAKPGLLACIIGGSYISGPSSMEPPKIWQMIGKNEVKAYNLPSGVIFDMLRGGAAQHPGVLTKVGMETFVDPALEGGAMNDAARIEPIVEQKEFEGEELNIRDLSGNRTLIRFDTGDYISLKAGREGVRFLLVAGKPIKEPVAWHGPIVMNTREELAKAFSDLRNGTFISPLN